MYITLYTNKYILYLQQKQLSYSDINTFNHVNRSYWRAYIDNRL